MLNEIHADFIKPTKATKIVKAVSVGEGQLLLLTSSGNLINARLTGGYHRNYAILPSPANLYLIKGMADLGITTKEYYNKVKAHVEKSYADSDKEYDIKRLNELAKKYNYKVTKQ